MDRTNIIQPPSRKEKLTLRILILLGLLSIINFFYWFFTPEFIDNQLLYWLLIGPLLFDSLRVIGIPSYENKVLTDIPGYDVVDFVGMAIYILLDKNITDSKKQESFKIIYNQKYWRRHYIDKSIFINEFGVKVIVTT